MRPKFETENGWTEAILDDDCEFEKFYRIADTLQTNFNLNFTKKLDDFDTIYWDFNYKENKLVLFYNTFEGTTIFPRAFKEATQSDNESVIEIGTLLFQKLIDLDWSDFDSGKTIGTKGSEGGIIIQDIENSNGARITLEKECRKIPYVITIGVYGLMFHTHYESKLEKSNEYVTKTKYKANKLFDLYNVEKARQDDFWQSKHDKTINELAEIFDIKIKEESKPLNMKTKTEKKWWQRLFD